MFIVLILCILLAGYSIVNKIDEQMIIIEKVALGYLIGIGFVTIIMLLYDIFGIKITVLSLHISTTSAIVLLNYKYLKNIQKLLNNIKKLLKYNITLTNINILWALLAGLLIVALFSSTIKALYWPTHAYDNVAGYDLIGKVIAAEGSVNNSLMDENGMPMSGLSNRIKYPPLVSGSFAIAYLCGLRASKIISSLFFISFIIWVYWTLKRHSNPLSAILITLLLAVTPELFAFSSLSTTNIPAAIYIVVSIVYLYEWTNTRIIGTLVNASVMLALACWARSDSIVFIISGIPFVYFKAISGKRWIPIVVYMTISSSVYIFWLAYTSTVINISQDVFTHYLFWDPERIKLMLRSIYRILFNSSMFGITFYLFIIMDTKQLKKALKQSKYIYTSIKNVAQSGMSREIAVYIVNKQL